MAGLLKDGVSKLNPPMDTVIDGHTLIVVTEDDSSLDAAARALTEPALTMLGTEVPAAASEPTQALLIGWNERAPIILRELDHYAAPGSTLTVLTSLGEPDVPALPNLAVTVVRGSTTDRATLERQLTRRPRPGHRALLLRRPRHPGRRRQDPDRAAPRARHPQAPGLETPVVSEMLDDRNRALASVADVDDVVVSGEIVSLLVTQLSEDLRLEAVFRELLDNDGSEIYLRPASWYVQPGDEVSTRRSWPAPRGAARPRSA